MASTAQINATTQTIALEPVMSISSTRVEENVATKPASEKPAAEKPGKQLALKMPVAKRIRITVPQAKALAYETRTKMLAVVKQAREDFKISAEYLAEKQRFQETNEVCLDITKMLKAFNRFDLSNLNRGMKAAYDNREVTTMYSELMAPDVTSRLNLLTNSHLERVFAKEIKELEIVVASQDTIFNRIMVNTIALNTAAELVTFQDQIISELTPRIGRYLAEHGAPSLAVTA